MQNESIIKQVNDYAMQNGVILGLFGIATLTTFKWSLTMPFFGILFEVMLLGSPVFATILTLKYRRQQVSKNEPFSFLRGFLHALFMGFYASLWIALIVFIYLRFFDHGTIFAAYEQMLDTPMMRDYLRQSGLDAQIAQISGTGGVKGLAAAMQSIGPATYASLFLYFPMIFGPIISAIIGLICRRS